MCHNLNDGYECLSSATFNGVNSTVQYTSIGIDGSATNNNQLEHSIKFSFRTRQGGTVLTIQNEASQHVRFLRLDIESRGVAMRWIAKSGLVVNESLHELPGALNGSWHSVSITLPGNFSLAELVSPEGQITLGGGVAETTTVHSLVERQAPQPDETTIAPVENETAAVMLIIPDSVPYRGCLNEFRVGGLLLPFFPTSDLLNDPSARKFRTVSSDQLDNLELECRLCYDHECQNGAKCLDPLANYTCDCLAGYEGDLCQINIDECVTNSCVNGNCLDGVANYTCQCQTGWTGWL